MNSKTRFGLAGFGLFGRLHAEAIANNPRCELAAVCVASESSRQAAREAHPQAAVLATFEQLLQDDSIDIIDIVTPNQTHYEFAKAALTAGKHVLLEKPMALSVAHCDDLVDTAERMQRVLAIGHELRLSSLWGQARELIEQGKIGPVQHVLIELSRFPYRQGSGGWRYDRQRVGSWILEEPIHFFDLAHWYLREAGAPVSVYARANSRDPNRPDLQDNFTSIVNYSGGQYALVSQTLAAFGHHQTAKIVGAQGTIWAWWSAADARSPRPTFGMKYGLGDKVVEAAFSKPAGELLELADEIDAVARCVTEGAPPPCNGYDGRWATLLCLASEESVRRGEVVQLQSLGG